MTKKYQILARKYRPQNFSQVVGQEAVVTTLKNSIKQNKTAHAYLFSGSRGIGKTTLARLFAKALNCQNLTQDIEPCNQCISCKEIADARSLDVIEIDGASNRGIDDIRQINDTIGYASIPGRHKIYIIDEVHMLTKEAFNALLKTLEEPPSNIKFFFATTEAHKVLPTIISRCQRFDLSRISHIKIVQTLSNIIKELGREVEDEALHLIASYSEGSLRDAESLLDQILCFEEGKITSNIINKTLGLISSEYFFQLDIAVKNSDISFAFEFVNKIFLSGKDLSYLLDELIEHYRRILIIKIGKEDVDLAEKIKEEYKETAQNYSKEQCLFILQYLIDSLQHYPKSIFKRATFEMILLQVIKSSRRVSPTTLLQKVEEIENNIQNISLKEPINIKNPNQNISSENITPSIPTPPIEKDVKLEEVQFTLNNVKQPSNDLSKPQSHYDTLLGFAAVELSGIIKK